MTASSPREIPFRGVRLRFNSERRFDEVLAALLADVGAKPLAINDIAVKFENWESYKKEIESHVGPSGFILFATVDHGSWIKKAGILKKVLRLVIGNPLLAITMIRHDVTAGLFAPVELLLVEEDHDQSNLTYVKPSSLMAVETNDALLAAARELDAKLQTLATKVTMAKLERSPRMASRVLNTIRRAPRAHANIGAIPRGALTGQFSGKEVFI